MKKITVRFVSNAAAAETSSARRKNVELSNGGPKGKAFDKFFDALVSSQGKASTVEGEIIRAMGKVGYRWYNDGDKFYEGYGAETAGPSASYLYESPVPGMAKLVDAAERARGDSAYEKCIQNMVSAVVEYVESKKGKYTKNSIDNLDTNSKWRNDDNDYDEDDNEWDD
jgi:hypothetical protein